MRAVLVVVSDVFTPKSPEVMIVQRDYLIQDFAANTADPALRHSVGLGSPLYRMETVTHDVFE